MADAPTGKSGISRIATALIAMIALVAGGGLVFAAIWANDYWHQEERKPPPVPPIPTENVSIIDQNHTAQHEAGHVIERYLRMPASGVDQVYVFVTKPESDDAWGRTFPGDYAGPDDEAHWHAESLCALAGEATEQLFRNEKPPEKSGDRDHAGENIISTCKTGACGPCPKTYLVGDVCLHEGFVVQETPKRYAEAEADIKANKETIAALSNLLMEQPEVDGRRTLSRAQIEEFLLTHPLVDPLKEKK